MRELYRRGGALLFFLLALGSFLSMREVVLRIAPVDMGAEYRRAYTPVQGWGATAASRAFLRDTSRFIPLAAFIEKEIGERGMRVSGPAWERLSAFLFDGASEKDLASRRSEDVYDTGSLYFTPSEEPFREVYESMEERDQPFRYLRFYSSRGPRFFSLSSLDPGTAASRGVPSFVLRPFRRFSLFFLICALGIYFLLPSRKAPEDALGYSRMGSVYVPDVLGLFLSGLFFGAPFLMVPEIFQTARVLSFSEGSLYFTLFWWFLAALAATLFYVSAKYATFWLLLLPERVEVHTLRGDWNMAYQDIQLADFKDYRPPGGLRIMMRLGSLMEPRLLAQSLLLESRRDWGVRLVRKDGESFSFLCSGLRGVCLFFEALERAGVPLSEKLREVVNGRE